MSSPAGAGPYDRKRTYQTDSHGQAESRLVLSIRTIRPPRGLPQPDGSIHLLCPLLAALFGASVVLRVHFQFRREVHSITLMELPLVLGLYFVDPIGLVLARLAGSIPVLVLHSRQRGSKLLFNAALFALEAGVAGLVFAWLLASQAPASTAGLFAGCSAST